MRCRAEKKMRGATLVEVAIIISLIAIAAAPALYKLGRRQACSICMGNCAMFDAWELTGMVWQWGLANNHEYYLGRCVDGQWSLKQICRSCHTGPDF